MNNSPPNIPALVDSISLPVDIVTRNSTHLAVAEFALGSLAHALHIPFTGHILSLNQGAFLCHGSKHSSDRKASARACYEISGVAAVFKSLAPTGKKIGPMLGLLMQGLLFSAGILIFGNKKVGQVMAMILLSIWAFIHPFMTLMISLGPAQVDQVIQFYMDKINLDYFVAGYVVLSVISILFLIKVLAAIYIVHWINHGDEEKWIAWQESLIQRSKNMLATPRPLKSDLKKCSPLKDSLRELTRPLFLFSFLLTWIFLFVQKESWSSFIWLALRPVAIAFFLLYLLRSTYFLKLCAKSAEKIRFLRPLHQRFLQVQKYWLNV